MKISIDKIKTTPANYGFNFCVFGELNEELKDWCSHWKLNTQSSQKYTNIIVNNDFDIQSAFNEPLCYDFVDGFSPNLNKHLHLGHYSNLVIANALQHLNLGKNFIAVLGDTLEGNVSKKEALEIYFKHCENFNYKINKIFYASELTVQNHVLKDGKDKYYGSKIFDLGNEIVVGVKSSGQTSYFYQDVAVAEQIKGSILYLTGVEQKEHFSNLKKIFPAIHHIGLGLVLLNSKKMSSREGNVLLMQDFIDSLMEEFNDIKLVYNIMAGQMLKSSPEHDKNINTTLISNPKLSLGLYLSYTMAHIKSCDVPIENITNFYSKELQFNELKSKINLAPNFLFDSLVKHAKNINALYQKNHIKGNQENIKIFSELVSDLALGMKKLGMFCIDKV